MSPDAVLKIGGSVLTDKANPGVIREDELAGIAAAIATRPRLSLVIVHGAGSLGHPEAERYHITAGVDQSNREGVYVTHAAVRRLNEAIVTAIRDAGREAAGISPLCACSAENGRIRSFAIEPLLGMLELGIVPVIHGDVVMDTVRGGSIVSGDQLVRHIALATRPKKVGLATDVPGVLSAGRVVPEITPVNATAIRLGRSGHTDVTGGMEGKVRELLSLAADGIPSDIFSVSRIGDFLDGAPHGGSRVHGG